MQAPLPLHQFPLVKGLLVLATVVVVTVALVVIWNLSALPDANATFRENAGSPLVTSPPEALDAAEDRIGYRPLVPDFPVGDLLLTDVRLTMPPASNARYPRTQLDFRSTGGASRLVLVAQGREDWLPRRDGWERLDLGVPGVQAVRAGNPGTGDSVEYRMRVGEWRYAILFFGPAPPGDAVAHMLQQVARQLIDSPPPDCHDLPVHAGAVPGCAAGDPP